MQCPSTTHRLVLALLVAAAQPAWSASDCDAPPESWQPQSAVQALAERNGWQVDRLKIDDGCYELRGRDAAGRRFKAKLDPATLQVLHMRRNGHGQRERERSRHPESHLPPSTGVNE